MNLKFEQFRKIYKGNKELDDIRIKSFDLFKKKDFPSKKEENWKYTDLKTIIYNNLNSLEAQNLSLIHI